MQSSFQRQRAELVAGILMAVLVLGVLAFPLLTGRVYTFGDIGNWRLPVRAFFSESLKNHEGYEWCPTLGCGYYLLGEGQLGMYHPLHQTIYRLLPLGIGLNVEFLVNYATLFLGFTLFLRRQGLNLAAAVYGGLFAGFGGYSLCNYSHMPVLAGVSYVPFLLVFSQVVLGTKKTPFLGLSAVGLAVLTTLQLLCSHPQFVALSLIFEGFFALFVFSPWTSRRLGVLGSAKLAGVMLAAVQILPVFEATRSMRRPKASAEFATSFSLSPVNLVQAVAPYAFIARVVDEPSRVNMNYTKPGERGKNFSVSHSPSRWSRRWPSRIFTEGTP